METGLAVRVHVGAGGGGGTVMVVEHVLCPPGPVTVIVYSVVAVSETDLEPEDTGDTLPTL